MRTVCFWIPINKYNSHTEQQAYTKGNDESCLGVPESSCPHTFVHVHVYYLQLTVLNTVQQLYWK